MSEDIEEDPFGRKAAAVEFLSMPIDKQHEWIKGLVFLARRVEERKQYERYVKKETMHSYKWRSYLNEQEIMMFGNLEREEAENVYNRSQKKGYKCLSPISRKGKKNHYLFEMDLPEEDIDEPFTYPSSSDDNFTDPSSSDDEGEGDYCAETKSNQTDEGVTKINVYNKKARKKIVEKVMAYRKRLEEIKQKHMKVTQGID